MESNQRIVFISRHGYKGGYTCQLWSIVLGPCSLDCDYESKTASMKARLMEKGKHLEASIELKQNSQRRLSRRKTFCRSSSSRKWWWLKSLLSMPLGVEKNQRIIGEIGSSWRDVGLGVCIFILRSGKERGVVKIRLCFR
jgi:hypothetical protein